MQARGNSQSLTASALLGALGKDGTCTQLRGYSRAGEYSLGQEARGMHDGCLRQGLTIPANSKDHSIRGGGRWFPLKLILSALVMEKPAFGRAV